MEPRTPTKQEIIDVHLLIRSALESLNTYDSDIFDLEFVMDPGIVEQPNVVVLNRELHECTINHRFAVYLEQLLPTSLKMYHVDIEYNRYLNQAKELLNIGRVRPDIVIHSRTDQNISLPNYLVVEAKKHDLTKEDINKIKGFIIYSNFCYLFGITVSYCGTPRNIIYTLYYFKNGKVFEESPVSIPRNT